MAALIVVGLWGPTASAAIFHDRFELARANRRLHGQVLDYTNNHGQDRRIWSDALCAKRDLYVYLPPGYDPALRYPLIYWLHMGREDERDFLVAIVQKFDKAMACGELPPAIIVAPDGSFTGKRPLLSPGSFFINSQAGRYGDYIVHDVWEFVTGHFPVRPEREAHVLMGPSMGGFGAYNLGFRYPERFKVLAGMYAPLNVRWVDCHGRYRANFDPDCWGWREQFPPHEVVAWVSGIPVFLKNFSDPLFGRGPDLADTVSQENPSEMLAAYDVQPGQYDLFVGYGGKDELNIDAQVESFLYLAQGRGLEVEVSYLPKGRHDLETTLLLLPDVFRWLAPKLCAYAPGTEIPE